MNADNAEHALGLDPSLNSGAVNNGGGNDVAEGGGVQISKNEAVNNGMAIAVDGNGVAEGDMVQCLKNGNVDNEVVVAHGFGVTGGGSGRVECLRTYKRRKRVKSSSESKFREESVFVKAASHLSDQVSTTPFTTCVAVMVL